MTIYRMYIHDGEQFVCSDVFALERNQAESVANYLQAKGTPVLVRQEIL